MKLCKDCIYCKPFYCIPFIPIWKDWDLSVCTNMMTNLEERHVYITGVMSRSAGIERYHGSNCGRDAKLFKKKGGGMLIDGFVFGVRAILAGIVCYVILSVLAALVGD